MYLSRSHNSPLKENPNRCLLASSINCRLISPIIYVGECGKYKNVLLDISDLDKKEVPKPSKQEETQVRGKEVPPYEGDPEGEEGRILRKTPTYEPVTQ